MTEPLQRPDWAIFGAPMRHRVMVLASRSLSEAELSMEVDRFRDTDLLFGDYPIWYERSRTYTLMVTMDKFVVIVADDYSSALRRLFYDWSPPDARPTRALPTSPLSIDRGER